MKASDTVMPFSQIEAIDLKNAESNFTDALYDVAREQAEISFKSGIKEVVEWVDKWREVVEHGDYSNGNEAFGVDEGRVLTYQHIENLDKQWQSKLKEWGIE